jgi:thiol:disulfide interchange protein
MKKTIHLFLALVLAIVAQAQILEPVKWTFEQEKVNDVEYVLIFKAKIDQGWYLYSQFVDPSGPVPTTFTLEQKKNVTIIGKISETSPKIKEGYDEMFEMNIKKFSKEATFKQKIKLTGNEGKVTGFVEFMTCDDEQCLPPQSIPFSFTISKEEEKKNDNQQNLEAKKDSIEKAKLAENALLADTNLKTISKDLDSLNNDINDNQTFILKAIDLENPVSQCGELKEEATNKKSIWVVFLLGFGGGLLALLTPCVFPMIPLTVSFFTKGSKDRKKGLINAFLYGFFILMVYVLLSVPFHILDSLDPNILNDISTNVWLNIAFFLIFIFFAFSFFGYYEIELPSWLADKSSKAEGTGGLLGIFFMAITLAIVSFSCTGPILGMLIGSLASSGGANAWQLTAGMAGFGMALALPFTLFAAFPSFLNSLPKSGGWMNTVKVVLGFLEIALAFKFLSNADLVKEWGILKYELFIGIWIVVFVLMAIYLFGKIKFPHDGLISKLSPLRITTGILAFAFAIYLASAFIYNDKTKTFTNLSLLSGLAPPAGYSWIYPNHCPQNFECFHDYYEAQAYAKKVGKPIMIDFTGHACVNCRKVEENVWDKEKVHQLISEEYVLVSLYVDEKIELPIEEQITVEYNGREKKLKTVGDKWAFMEYANFKRVSQPYYCLVSPDGVLLNNPIGYSSSSNYVEEYVNFLNCGLEAYQSIQIKK